MEPETWSQICLIPKPLIFFHHAIYSHIPDTFEWYKHAHSRSMSDMIVFWPVLLVTTWWKPDLDSVFWSLRKWTGESLGDSLIVWTEFVVWDRNRTQQGKALICKEGFRQNKQRGGYLWFVLSSPMVILQYHWNYAALDSYCHSFTRRA